MQNYCSTIQTLVNNGNIVLQVIYGDNAEYFCVYEWKTAEENSVSYHQLIGINITNFLNNNHGVVSQIDVLARLQDYISSGEIMRVEFSKEAVWYKWSSYNGNFKKW